jgi:hypothetical protein
LLFNQGTLPTPDAAPGLTEVGSGFCFTAGWLDLLSFDPNLLVVHFGRNLEQAGALTGTACAEAGQWIVNSAVRFADDLLAVTREELVVAVIDREREVTADVFVNNDLALKKRGETVARNSFTPEFEFH